jgi:hypothetical protein
MSQQDLQVQSDGRQAVRPGSSEAHANHCFIVMPYGRTEEEVRWFKGWYEVVVRPAVVSAGYEPLLAATEEQPGAINDDIRAHLAFDPMVVVDLGGADPEEDPNPNVMYELGIRHALGLPLVMMAWQSQRLPFDVGNQRVIMERRDLVDLDTNRRKLLAFIQAAAEGRYYRPMEAVSRIATIEAASLSLGPDSILGVLVEEIKELRNTLVATTSVRGIPSAPKRATTIRRLLSRRAGLRKELLPHFLEAGGTTHLWGKLLRTEVPAEFSLEVSAWGADEWKAHLLGRVQEADLDHSVQVNDLEEQKRGKTILTEDFIQTINQHLPAQPWPTGIHRIVAAELGIPSGRAYEAIHELIRRGVYTQQSEGAQGEDSPAEDVLSEG